MDGSADTVRVWDPLIRIGHWVLVVAFATAYLTEGEPEWLHTYAGYAIAATVALRVLWGFIGPERARFSDFVTGPGRVFAYLKGLVTGRAERHVGHNPAGAAMTLALLTALSITALSGMATLAAEEGKGPLAGLVGAGPATSQVVDRREHEEYGDHDEHGRDEEEGHDEGAGEIYEEIHEVAANATLLLIVLHVVGVLWSSLAHRENLVASMITGRKRAAN
jgi:cytochrome b